MCVCCGNQSGRCVLFTNILGSLTVPCLVYSTAMYTVCGQYGRCVVHTLAGAWFIWSWTDAATALMVYSAVPVSVDAN